jgi:hypothetical protein
MKDFWRRILNIFHPEVAAPTEDWQKEIYEELDNLSPTDEKYWKVVELLADKDEAEMYLSRKKYPRTTKKNQEREIFDRGRPVISENYKRSLHENPHYKKRPW